MNGLNFFRARRRRLDVDCLASARLCSVQDDFALANADGATFRADLNANLQALATLSSGSSAPATTYAYQLWADTTNGLLKQRNAANTAWIVRGTLAETRVSTRSSDTILASGDFGKTFVATGSYTQTLTAAATLADGWFVDFIVASGVTLTLDPNSSETIDGSTTRAIVGPASGRIVCDGSAFRTIGFIEFATQAEMEAASATNKAVTAGRQHYHPSAAKCWVRCGVTGNDLASYNVSSITDTAVGKVTVNIDTDFSSANYAVVGGGIQTFGGSALGTLSYTIQASPAVGSFAGQCVNLSSYVNTDPVTWAFAAFGDQA